MNIVNLIIIIMILILLTIIYFIINICNQKIETFVDSITIEAVPYPDIKNSTGATITNQLVVEGKDIITDKSKTENIKESLDYDGDFFIIRSSYKKTSGSLSSLLYDPPTEITLMTDNLYDRNGNYNIKSGFSGTLLNNYNYISILFPYTNMTAHSIEITYKAIQTFEESDFKNDPYKYIFRQEFDGIYIYTSDEITYTELKSMTGRNFIIPNNPTTPYKLIFNLDGKLIKRYLYIFISPAIKSITITNIKFLLKNIHKNSKTGLLEDDENIIKYNTDNPAEQVKIPDTYIANDISESTLGTGTNVNNATKINALFGLLPPWAIYDGQDYKSIDGKRYIPDALGRECRNAIISGREPTIETENNTAKGVNIRYLSGKTDTIVRFPEYSLPEYYTICTITKYTNTNPNESFKRGRIITAADNVTNWLIGQHGDYTGMYFNNGWKTHWATNLSDDKNEWVVSCVKASYSTAGSLLLNGKERTIAAPGPIPNYVYAKKNLTINTDNYSQFSDFGLSYVIIWNIVLTNSQLKLVSDTLNEYVKTGIKIPLNNISIKLRDGKSQDTAGISALEIKRQSCTNTNGLYWILAENDTDTKNATRIYCIMDDLVFGGGWMMALKGDKNKDTFKFFSNHWTNNTTLNDKADNYEAFTDAKYNIYNTYKATDCLAIFDAKDTNGELTFINKPEYGWIWYQANYFNGQKISLLDFYKSKPGYPWGNHSYIYTSLNNNLNYVKQRMRDVDWYYGGGEVYVEPKYFDQYYINVTCTQRVPLNPKIFSRQDAFKAYGFNVVPLGWAHSVRWGGSFNENLSYRDGVPDSNDVSCGIGLQAGGRSAGDVIGCCESNKGTNAPMGFKWFIR